MTEPFTILQLRLMHEAVVGRSSSGTRSGG